MNLSDNAKNNIVYYSVIAIGIVGMVMFLLFWIDGQNIKYMKYLASFLFIVMPPLMIISPFLLNSVVNDEGGEECDESTAIGKIVFLLGITLLCLFGGVMASFFFYVFYEAFVWAFSF